MVLIGRGLDDIFDSRCLIVALCSFEGSWGPSTISGGYCVGEIPLPIPNRAVKPHSADGTWPARARESRSPPVYLEKPSLRGRLFVVLRSFAGREAWGCWPADWAPLCVEHLM